MKTVTHLLLALAFPILLSTPSLAENTVVGASDAAVNSARESRQPITAPERRTGYRTSARGLPVFGSQLFQGEFGDLSFSGFNPNYQLAVGDAVQIMIWGALELDLEPTVDARGNIFIPRVGPVPVLGVRNEDLNSVIRRHIDAVYTNNVESYANLLSTQTARVFVSGFVARPGLYEGFSSDSVLYFLDRAGGVDIERGSYLRISVLRADQTIATINLYDFLRNGTLPPTHFRDGDVILVQPQAETVTIGGRVRNPGRFEFEGDTTPLSDILTLAAPEADATSASVRRARLGAAEATVVPLAEAASVIIQPGDDVTVSGRNIARNLLVTFTGEHKGKGQVVLPLGATLSDAIALIEPSALSNLEAVQLFRESVAQRQRDLLAQSLDNLERSVLNARSVSLEEAQLRQVEAQTVLSFIERARTVRPQGQILIEDLRQSDMLHLEDRDIIHIPAKNRLVTVHGEVKYPNTQTHRDRESVQRYIDRAGGFTDNANEGELILVHPNGLIKTIGRGHRVTVGPGDEIIVMPEPDTKRLLFAKEISTILYQIALSARVAIGL